jgi:outer membrane receptor protein involved in Fe transport
MSNRLYGKNRHGRSVLAASVAATLAAALSAPTVSWAQSADATLRGHASANTAVTAKNVATGFTRHTQAGPDGTYELIGLPPGTYRVDSGPGTEAVVTLTVASTATLDLAAGAAPAVAPGDTLAEITVKAARLVEVKTSEVGATLTLQQIETVPQLTRNFLEFADTVPGVVFSVDSGGNASLRGGAMNTSSVNVYVDGVGQKSYVKEGGVSGQFFSQGNPFPQLGIGEYKVVTSNYKAEYDQVSSAAVIAETKSGTNEFHGEVFGTYTSDSFRAETPSEAFAGKKTPSKDKEYGFAFGGPIIQDQMHFFLTYEAKDYTTPVTVTPGVTTIAGGQPIIGLLPANVQSQFGPGTLPFTEHLFFGKIDWEPTDIDRFELSSQIRREDQIQNIGVAQAASASIDVKNNDTRVDLRWQRNGDHWLNEVLLTYEDAFNAPSARTNGNGAVYTYQPTNDPLIVDTGPASPGATQNKGQKGPAFQEDLTLHNLYWMGDHTLKMGVKLKEVTLTAQDAEDINPQFYYDVSPLIAGGTATDPYKVQFANPVPGLNPTAKSKNDQLGVYFQDDWAVNNQLTLNLGIRWDYEKTPSYTDYHTPANVIAAFNGPTNPAGANTYAQSLALGGVNINDYISNGHNRSPQTGEIQPRLGFSFDINADQKHVVFGGYGRSYDRDLYDYLELEQTKSALPISTINFIVPERPGVLGCTPSPTCVPWDPKYYNGAGSLQALLASTNTGNEVDLINNNLKAPYSDQFSIGMRNKVGDWNTSATLARILSKDGFVFTLGNRYPNGAFWMNGGQPWGNGVPGFGALILGSSGIETKTTEVLLGADKPYTEASHWGATIAYTFTDATQNRSITEHYSFDEETIKQYPFITSNAASRHRLVATGTVSGPWGTLVSAKLTLATPIPVDDIANFGLHYPTGSNGTPIAGTPKETFGYRQLDLQLTKDFALPLNQTIYVRVDMLNVFNYYNFSDTINNWGNNGVPNPNPVTYNPTGNITGVPRTFRVTAGYKF